MGVRRSRALRVAKEVNKCSFFEYQQELAILALALICRKSVTINQ